MRDAALMLTAATLALIASGMYFVRHHRAASPPSAQHDTCAPPTLKAAITEKIKQLSSKKEYGGGSGSPSVIVAKLHAPRNHLLGASLRDPYAQRALERQFEGLDIHFKKGGRSAAAAASSLVEKHHDDAVHSPQVHSPLSTAMIVTLMPWLLALAAYLFWRRRSAARIQRATAGNGGGSALQRLEASRKAKTEAAQRLKENGWGTPTKPVPMQKRVSVSSRAEAVERIKQHLKEYEYLLVGELLDAVRREGGGDNGVGGSLAPDAHADAALRALLADGQIEGRVAMAKAAMADLNTEGDGFELVQDDEVMRMFSRVRQVQPDSPDRVLTVKIESLLEGVRAEDTLFIFREAQFYNSWFPLISEGSMIHESHPFEGILWMLVETPFILADLVLTGWACDDLHRSGVMLMCVRPAKQQDCPPGIELPPHPSTTHAGRKIFPPTRTMAVIDVLFEPITPESVRFVFQVSLKLPPLLPAWALNYVLQNGMAKIFSSLKVVAGKMASNDPECPHVPYVASERYAPTREFIKGKVHGFLSGGSSSSENVVDQEPEKDTNDSPVSANMASPPPRNIYNSSSVDYEAATYANAYVPAALERAREIDATLRV